MARSVGPPPSSSSTTSPDLYLRQLALYIRQHELALAAPATTAFSSRRQPSSSSSSSSSPSPAASSLWPSLASLSTGFGLLATSSPPAPLTLSLDPHHLYYLLLKFEEIGLHPGPLDVSLRHSDPHQSPTGIRLYDPSRWMTGFNPAEKGRPPDISDSTSLFSNMSNLSLGSIWWTGATNPKPINRQSSSSRSIDDEVKYLYSSFTKLPSLRLSPSSSPTLTTSSSQNRSPGSMQLLEGFTDLPNENGVPLVCFKSLWVLSIHHLDPRIFIGWHRLSQSLRSLEIRQSGLEDIERLLVDAVMDDVKRLAKLETNQHDLAAEKHAAQESSAPQQPIRVLEEDLDHGKELTSSPTELITPVPHHPSHSQPDPAPPPTFPPLAWRFLHHLCLSDNALTFVPPTALVALVCLTSLDLSSNLLIVVPPGLSSLTRLKSLSLADNMIDSVLGIYQSLGNVTTINLSRNRLTSLCGLERLYALERLDIRENRISDISELSRLATLPSLTHLWPSSNPFVTLHPDWRVTVFNYFIDEKRDLDAQETSGLALRLDNTKPSFSERKYIKQPLTFVTTTTTKPITRRDTSTNEELVGIYEQVPKPVVPRRSRTATVDLITSSSEDTTSPFPLPNTTTTATSSTATTARHLGSKKDRTKRRQPRIISLDDHCTPIMTKTETACTVSGLPSSTTSNFPTRFSKSIRPASSTLAPTDEEFRRKFEKLRDEVGDGWLRVLGQSDEFGQECDSTTKKDNARNEASSSSNSGGDGGGG